MLKKLYLVAIGLCMFILSCYLILSIVWMVKNKHQDDDKQHVNITTITTDINYNNSNSFGSDEEMDNQWTNDVNSTSSPLIGTNNIELETTGDQLSDTLVPEMEIVARSGDSSYLSSVSRAWRRSIPSPTDLARRWWSSVSTYVPMQRSASQSPTQDTVNDTTNESAEVRNLSPLMLNDEQLSKMMPEVRNSKTSTMLLRCDKTFAYIKYLVGQGNNTDTKPTANGSSKGWVEESSSRLFSPIEQLIRPFRNSMLGANGNAKSRPSVLRLSTLSSDANVTGRYLELFNHNHNNASASDTEIIGPGNDDITLPELHLMPIEKVLPGKIVDCYLVDINKRPQEMQKFEKMLSESAGPTQSVGFDAMLAIMVECRRLSLSSIETLLSLSAMEPQPAPTPFPKSSSRGANEISSVTGTQGKTIELRQPVRRSSSLKRNTSEPDNQDELGDSLTATMIGGIAPGTVWCGLGDRAQGYRQLGREAQIDACCRSHDHCPIRLKPFTFDYGLSNWSVYTRSHCKCDIDLNDCLRRSNSTMSQFIRLLYFKFVGTQCIELYPMSGERRFDDS